MFDRWKKRRSALQPKVAQAPAEPDEARSGGEDGAGPASAGPAEDEPAERDSSDSTGRRFSPEERERLLALYANSDLTVRAFAKRHGVKYTTFRNWPYKRSARQPASTRKAQRFTPEERRTAVEAFVKSGRSRDDFARLWGCSPSSLDKWLKRYRDEGPKGLETRMPKKGRRRHHPKRISEPVRELVASVRAEHDDFGVTRIADHLKRFHGVEISPSTVRNILRERGVALQPGPRRKPRPKSKPPRRFERARPGELWQSDITSYVLRRQGRRVYLTVFLDDHSRYVVAWALATHQRTPLVTEPLLEGIARFGKPREVLTDQGRQYYAWRGKSGFQKLLAKEGIAHVVSRAHHPETLGKCERLWKTVADEFWDRAGPQDLEDARRRLAHWVRHYNHFRPHQGIDGLVPADRFFDAESTLRAALERELTQNELRLAIDEAPRLPVYLVGQIGEERIALHGERGRLVIDTPDGGRRELSMQDLGVSHKNHEQENSDDGAGREDRGECRDDADSGSREEVPHAHGTQTLGFSKGPEAGLAGARSVGKRARGGEAESARDVHEDARVLAGQEEQAGDRARARGHAAARVAALPASALGDAGWPVDPAAPARGSGSLRTPGGGVARGAEEAHHGAGEAARSHRGFGARPANGPVAEPGDGVTREGRLETCPEAESEAQGASQAKRGGESANCSEERPSRRRRVWRWLKRME